MRKILLGVAAGAVGLGALLFTRGKEQPQSSSNKPHGWVRSTRLAQPVDHPLNVVVDGDHLYFVGGGFARAQNAVYRMPTAGGTVQTLVTVPQILSGELVVDAEHVYFTSEAHNTVMRVAKAGGAAAAVAEAPAAKYLAHDATHVYFATVAHTDAGTVQRVAKTGGPAEVLLGGQAGLEGLVVDAKHVYVRSNQGVWKLPKSGGAAQSLLAVADNKNILRLVADETHLYFFLETENRGKFAVARLSKNGGAAEPLSTVVNSAARLALSDTHAYFFRAAGLNDDVLAKVSKNGGQTETVDGSGHNTGYLTVAQGNVYFTDVNTVYRVPK